MFRALSFATVNKQCNKNLIERDFTRCVVMTTGQAFLHHGEYVRTLFIFLSLPTLRQKQQCQRKERKERERGKERRG